MLQSPAFLRPPFGKPQGRSGFRLAAHYPLVVKQFAAQPLPCAAVLNMEIR